MVVRNGESRRPLSTTIPRSLRETLDRDLIRWITKDRKPHKLSEFVTAVLRAGLPVVEQEKGLRENDK